MNSEMKNLYKIKDNILNKLININVCHTEIELYINDFVIKVLLDYIPINYFNELNKLINSYNYKLHCFYFELKYGLYCFHCVRSD